MADDKVLITESTLDNIADATREKNGESFLYYPSEIPAAIRRIPTGTGGGSVVAVFPVLLSGTHIADIVVDGDTFELYAPTPKTYTQGTGIEISQNGVVSVSEALRQTIAGKVDTSSFNTAIASLSASIASKQDMLIQGDNITIQGNVISATGGGASAVSDLTDVDLNDLADGQVLKWNATSQKWENANESGGTTVIANPSGTPTEELSTIQIGEDIYEIVGGSGGSGYEQTELFTSATPVNSGTLNLSDDISNYDVLCFEYAIVGSYGSGDNSLSYKYVDAKYFIEAFPNTATRETDHLIIDGYDNFYLYAKMGNADNKIDVWNVGSPNTGITKVFGIKYGTGGGQGGSGYEETDLWTGSGNMFNSLSITLDDAYTNYDALRFEYQSVRADAQNIPVHYEKYISKETLGTSDRFSISDFYLWNNVGVNVSGTFTDTTHLTTYLEAYSWFSSCTLTKIVGIKYGAGGGGSSLPFNVVIDPNDNGINLVPNGGGGGGGSSYAESDKYSTTEKVIGEWINGKPIYQKTIESTMPSSVNVMKYVPIGSPIADVIKLDAILYLSQFNQYQPLFTSTDNFSYYGKLSVLDNNESVNPNSVTLLTNASNWLNKTVYITVQYTKTTD